MYGAGKELSYKSHAAIAMQAPLRCRRCRWNSSQAHILPSQNHDIGNEMPIVALDFITTFLGLLLAHRAVVSAYFVTQLAAGAGARFARAIC